MILLMSAKMATLGLLKVAVFWNKGYDVLISVDDVNNFGLALSTNFRILHQCDKRFKTKSQKVLGANSYVCRSYRGKIGRGTFLPPPTSPHPE